MKLVEGNVLNGEELDLILALVVIYDALDVDYSSDGEARSCYLVVSFAIGENYRSYGDNVSVLVLAGE